MNDKKKTQKIKKAPPYFFLLQKQWQIFFELCHFTSDLNFRCQRKTLQAKIQKLVQILLLKTKNIESEKDKLKIICQCFFSEMGFRVIDESLLDFESSLLHKSLASRQCPASLLMLILICFFEECGLKSQTINCESVNLLKVHLGQGDSSIISVDRRGADLCPRELTNLINQGVDFSTAWSDSRTLVIQYLSLVKKLAGRENNLKALSLTHSYLIKYQPFNLKHLAGRAIVSFEKGDYNQSIDDIRSYFQYRTDGKTNLILKKLYKQALKSRKSQAQV